MAILSQSFEQGIENLTETNIAKTLAVVSWADNLHFCQKQIEDCWKHFWKWHRLEIRIGGVSCYMYSDIKFLSPHKSQHLLIQTMPQLERHHYKPTDCLLLWDLVVVGLVFLFWDESISHWGWILSNWAFLATSWQFLTFTTNDYASLQCWGQASDN